MVCINSDDKLLYYTLESEHVDERDNDNYCNFLVILLTPLFHKRRSLFIDK